MIMETSEQHARQSGEHQPWNIWLLGFRGATDDRNDREFLCRASTHAKLVLHFLTGEGGSWRSVGQIPRYRATTPFSEFAHDTRLGADCGPFSREGASCGLDVCLQAGEPADLLGIAR
jgi:hypothetical protein